VSPRTFQTALVRTLSLRHGRVWRTNGRQILGNSELRYLTTWHCT
jgi:hypothetical protein